MHSEKEETEAIGTRVPKWMPPMLEAIRHRFPAEFSSRNAVQVEAFRLLIEARLGKGSLADVA